MQGQQHPLIVVFYLDREMMQNPEIMNHFGAAVNKDIADKNMLAYILPTDGEERVECINPVQVAPAEMDRINKILEDIKLNFDINPKIITEND